MDTHPLSIALQMLPTGLLAKPPVSRNLPQLLHASSIPVVNYLPDFAASTTLPQRPMFTRVTLRPFETRTKDGTPGDRVSHFVGPVASSWLRS